MKYRTLILPVSLVALVALAAFAVPPLLRPAAARSQLPLDEFMGHVVERNAEQLWAWSAEEIDSNGTRSSRPVTEKDWEDAESDSLSLTELSYALEGSAIAVQNDPEWRPHIARLRAAANASAQAAEKQDYAALQKASNAVNAACVSCHWRFAPALEVVPKYTGQ
jgi:cytochrome c553